MYYFVYNRHCLPYSLFLSMLRSANSNCITITCKKLITRCIMYKVEINGVYEYFMYQSIYGLYENVVCTYESKLEVYLREVYL